MIENTSDEESIDQKNVYDQHLREKEAARQYRDTAIDKARRMYHLVLT